MVEEIHDGRLQYPGTGSRVAVDRIATWELRAASKKYPNFTLPSPVHMPVGPRDPTQPEARGQGCLLRWSASQGTEQDAEGGSTELRGKGNMSMPALKTEPRTAAAIKGDAVGKT